ncbi:MAG: hypothetical protein WC614_07620 [bacterium]
MWSLPDINKMNDEAVKQWRAEKRKQKKDILKGQECEICGNKATIFKNYYDIFSKTPKGHIFLCGEHQDETPEGYFTCSDCQRIMAENYTWENYYVDVDGDRLCLKCYFEREVNNPNNWLNKEAVDKLTFEQVRKSKHLIAVESKYWQGAIDCISNVEFDYGGGRLTGSSSCENTPNGGVREIKEICYTALEKHNKVMLITDGCYQFSLSLGIYVRKHSLIKNKTAGLCPAGA